MLVHVSPNSELLAPTLYINAAGSEEQPEYFYVYSYRQTRGKATSQAVQQSHECCYIVMLLKFSPVMHHGKRQLDVFPME